MALRRQYRSASVLLAPYSPNDGWYGKLSSIGRSVFGCPKTDAVLTTTSTSAPLAIAASTMFRVPRVVAFPASFPLDPYARWNTYLAFFNAACVLSGLSRSVRTRSTGNRETLALVLIV